MDANRRGTSRSWTGSTRIICGLGALLLLAGNLASIVRAQEAHWIWAPGVERDAIDTGSCYFRRTFNVANPTEATITIAADDAYELYVNGKRVAEGDTSRQLDRFDISNFIDRGKNVIAVKVENREGNTAGLAARLQVKEEGGQWRSFSTNQNWKTNRRPLPLWQTELYNDRRWEPAQLFGPLERSEPRPTEQVARDSATTGPSNTPATAGSNSATPASNASSARATTEPAGRNIQNRFQVAREFQVELLLDDEYTGSLIAMAFNEFGQLILSQEGGPLLLASPSETGVGYEEPRVYCELVSSCQGLLPLNGDVYVTGQGPQGVGLYRLSDPDRDGVLESAVRLLAFRGGLGEHGPHGLTLGPDGMIYCVVGNFSGADVTFSETSPIRNVYEGDLLDLKMEDPSGHATGVRAPGGTIVRCSLDGSKTELVASGLRNCYDLTFNNQGELFTYDSDMESDIGMAWYRPTRLMHIVPGGEFGWRSGWSKWPDYYLDSLPPIAETGRGSPTGLVTYDHFMFPTKYHGALFLGDWSEGRIIAVTLKSSGAGYMATPEVFLQGEPLNVTDLEVGPDGALYFITGGRATSGGLYRVSWLGTVPESVRELSDDLTGVIRQPQLQSAWARQRVARLRVELDEEWTESMRGVVVAKENPAHYRTRALDLLQLYGPKPDAAFLGLLVTDSTPEVRAKVAELLGLLGGEAALEPLSTLLRDDDRLVRRKAAEGLVRSGLIPEFASLKRMLISDDRAESWAARRLLERLDPSVYHDEMLSTDNHRLFIQCATANLVAHPSLNSSYEVLARVAEHIQEFISDRNFIDMLRVVELALERGDVDPAEIPAFAEMIADEFPSGNSIMNRELAKILAYMKCTSVGERLATYLKGSSGSPLDRIQVAMMFQTIREGWTSDQRLALIDFLEKSRLTEGGGSYAYYIMDAAKELGRSATESERALILAKGDQWPNAVVGVFYTLAAELDDRTIRAIQSIDEKIVSTDPEDDSYTQLKIGIVAVLARSGDEKSMAYLRKIWERDEERRGTVALGLAQSPTGENWSYLINSLDLLEEPVAREVLTQLVSVERRPNTPDHFRQVIMLGLKLKEQGSEDAIKLLEHWTGEHLTLEGDPWDVSMEAWQRWFAGQFPDQPAIEIDEPTTADGWDLDEIAAIVEASEPDEESVLRGRAIFASAQCGKCHRVGNQGESVGPDLTSVARRFSQREILESIIEPSNVVSDQYQTQIIETLDGQTLSGLVTRDSQNNYVVLQPDGTKRTVAEADVDGIAPSDVSSMPEGLINHLSSEEVVDLMAFLTQGVAAPIATRPSDSGSSRRQ